MLAVFGIASTQASATLYVHPLLAQFGPKGPGSTAKFVHPVGVGVDQGTHDVYVFDRTKESQSDEYTLYKFNAAGEPDPFTAGPGAGTNAIAGLAADGAIGDFPGVDLAVAPPGSPAGTAGDLYALINNKVEVYSPTGAHLGTIDGSGNPSASTPPLVISVDGAGDLYIGYVDHVDKYVPTANPPKNSNFDSELRFELASGETLHGLVANSSNLFVTFHGPNVRAGGHLLRYPLTFPGGGGSALASPEAPPTPVAENYALSVDPSSGDLFAPNEYGITFEDLGQTAEQPTERLEYSQYDAAGDVVSTILIRGEAVDIGVDGSSGRIYLSIEQNPVEQDVRVYGAGEPVEPPSVAIDPASGVSFKSAHLTGTVNPGGSGALQDTAYRFHCIPKCPGLEAERTIPGDGADHLVSDDTVGLEPETTYAVKLIARNIATTRELQQKDVGNHRAISFPAEPGEVVAATSFETGAKPAAEAPEVTVSPASEVGSDSARLRGTVDPKGSGELQATTYGFEFSSDGLIWIAAPGQGPIEGGSQEVSTVIGELAPNTTYQVRLHAENVGGIATSAPPNPTFTTAAVPPLVETTDATRVLAGSVQLNGRLDPGNSQTSYYFQWGTADCASNPCASVPASEDGDAGSGLGFIWVHAQIGDLSPGSTYFYRLVARNPAGQVTGSSASFTTAAPQIACQNEEQRLGTAAALPDCRAYEMVSPLEKNGGSVATQPIRTRVAPDGNAVTFKSTAAFAGATGSPWDGVEYMSQRGPDGWGTHAISPSQQAPYSATVEALTGPLYVGEFSPDFDTGVFLGFSPIAGATSANVDGRDNLYLATGLRSGMPSFQLLSDSESPLPPPDSGIGVNTVYVGASADHRKIVFETTANLVAPAFGDGFKLYEWEAGELRLAGILPDSACASPPCPAEESIGGTGAGFQIGSLVSGSYTETKRVVSEDGSTIFFTVPSKRRSERDQFRFSAANRLFARIDGHSTVQIDASERSTPDPDGPGRSVFGGASADGKVVYFSSSEMLVDGVKGASLYRYDFRKPAGQRLTAIPLPSGEAKNAEFEGVSRSGSFAYVRGEHGTEGHLYVVHGDRASKIGDPKIFGVQDFDEGDTGSFHMTPDGRYASFVTKTDLTGYEAHSPACTSNECTEVYLYSYDSGELSCVSCNVGQVPTGEAFYSGQGHYREFGLPGPSDPRKTSPLSSDGRYVFFSSPDALVPMDSNGTYDAYVFDSAKGEVRLLSSGQCNCKSEFINASPDGHDAFFTTSQRLVRSDTDTQADLYDARIGGGIPSQNVAPAPGCQGDACQPLAGQATQVTPASAAFRGPGNLAPGTAKGRHRKHRHKRRHRRQRGREGASHRRAGHVNQGDSK